MYKKFIKCHRCHELKGCDDNGVVRSCEKRGCNRGQQHQCIKEMSRDDAKVQTGFQCAICSYIFMRDSIRFSSDG